MERPRSCSVFWLVGKENAVIHTAKKEGCEGDNENELSGTGGSAVVRPEGWEDSCPSLQARPD